MSAKKDKSKTRPGVGRRTAMQMIGATIFNPHEKRRYYEEQAGLHRAPSEVRKISVEDYLKEKSAGK